MANFLLGGGLAFLILCQRGMTRQRRNSTFVNSGHDIQVMVVRGLSF